MNIKNILISIALCSLMTSAFAQKTPTVVTVNIREALAGYSRLQEAQVKLESSVQEANEELEVEREELRVVAEDLRALQEQSQNPSLTEEKIEELRVEFDAKAADFQQMQNEFNQFAQRTQNALKEREANILNLHLEEVKDAIRQVCRDKGADLALNTEGNQVLYSDKEYDITGDVLQVLNADIPAE